MQNNIKVDVVITNYNYSQYIEHAIASVQNQNIDNLKIIVVDDGSTDGSVSQIKKFTGDENFLFIEKPNGGQLSCLNAAFPYIDGDYVFFLDADDAYKSNYVKMTLDFYVNHPYCDFLFCQPEFIDENDEKINIKRNKHLFPQKKHYGYTPIITYLNYLWIGEVTSCISMKRTLLEKILPIPYEEDWKIRADDCLVWGGSLMSGYKCFLNDSLVKYRVHDNNFFFGRELAGHQRYRRTIAFNSLFAYLTRDYHVRYFEHLIYLEFKSLPEKQYKDVKHYLKALLKTNVNYICKTQQALSIIKNYLIK